MASEKKKNKKIEKSYKAEIEVAEKSIEKEKKQYYKSVKALLKAEKNLRPIAKKAAKKPTDKNLEKQAFAKKELSNAALEYKAIGDSIDTQLSELEQKSDYLSRFYYQIGKSKDANKEKARFEKYYDKQTAELCKASKNSDEVVSAAFEDTVIGKKKKEAPNTDSLPVPAPVEFEQEAAPAVETAPAPKAEAPVEEAPKAEAPKAEPAPQCNYYAPYPYGYPCPPAPQQPAAPEIEVVDRQINIAPVDLDVTEIVTEAVNATIKSFTEIVETKIKEYAETITLPTVAVAAPVATEDTEGRAEALAVVAEEQGFVVSKLSELIDGVKEIMEAINELTAKSAEILEKQKAASEVQNELTKTQRTTMREIQGIQVRQKLVITEQEALVAEQTVAFEHHKLVAEAQKALSEQQQISVEEINALVDSQKALNLSVKETVDSNKSIVAMAEKTAEAQKNLNEKQQDLIALQKEAMAAHRQIARGQRSAESKRRTAEKKTEAPVVEAEVALEEMATE